MSSQITTTPTLIIVLRVQFKDQNKRIQSRFVRGATRKELAAQIREIERQNKWKMCGAEKVK